MAASDVYPPLKLNRHPDAPLSVDLDKCVHCGLCLNACPTYRELRVEMDSPRGRIYQMVQVATGQAEPDASYREHIDLCLACRGCETACPSGVPYGRMVEAARAEIEASYQRPLKERLIRWFVFRRLLTSPALMRTIGGALGLYEGLGLRKLVQSSGLLRLLGKLGELEPLAPSPEAPFFFRHIGQTFPAIGVRRYRVAFLGGCIANVFFARLNEATVRVLQQNGCEVVIPANQGCCGALHVHAGVKDVAMDLARQNIDAILGGGFDAIIANAGGCGSTLKEYDHLLERDPAYREKGREWVRVMKDVNEFLGGIELNRDMRPLNLTVTYQDSCHLAHGQKVRAAPRQLLQSIPGVELREMALSDLCCGSAGIYNVVHADMAAAILDKKMPLARDTGAGVIATANPGCMLQLRAGVAKYDTGQRVAHVVELLDAAYGNDESYSRLTSAV